VPLLALLAQLESLVLLVPLLELLRPLVLQEVLLGPLLFP
jgi:hypothetical protein